MAYDNTAYWTRIHLDHGGLRAVGWPGLSEEFNKLKYGSEADAIVGMLRDVATDAKASGRDSLKICEAGAGTGFWLDLVQGFFDEAGLRPELTAIDISEEALRRLEARKPGLEALQEDLKTVDPGRYADRFDLFMALYVFHHLPTTSAHLNALRLAARSLKPGGSFILMDPILTKGYSQFDVIDFESYRGNGVPRHLYFIDDILSEEGLRRVDTRSAVSFLFNGTVEANSALRYKLERRLWWLLQKSIYKNDGATKSVGGILKSIDAFLKRVGAGNSALICRYVKRED